MSKKVISAQVSTKEAHSQTSSEPQLHISHLSTSDLSTEATDDTVPSSCIFFTFSKDSISATAKLSPGAIIEAVLPDLPALPTDGDRLG